MAANGGVSHSGGAGPHCIKLFVQREGMAGWNVVYVDPTTDVADAKKVIMLDFRIGDMPDEVVLCKQGATKPLDDCNLIDGQLVTRDKVIVKVVRTGLSAGKNKTRLACWPFFACMHSRVLHLQASL